jgi:hypothetical protein
MVPLKRYSLLGLTIGYDSRYFDSGHVARFGFAAISEKESGESGGFIHCGAPLNCFRESRYITILVRGCPLPFGHLDL